MVPATINVQAPHDILLMEILRHSNGLRGILAMHTEVLESGSLTSVWGNTKSIQILVKLQNTMTVLLSFDEPSSHMYKFLHPR